MKKTMKSILSVIMVFIMASGFVTAFAVESEETKFPSDYVEEVIISNYKKCSTITETEDGEYIIPSTEGETIIIIFVDGTRKSFVYTKGVKIDFPDGKEYEVYAGIDGTSMSHAVLLIDEDGEEYIIWLGFADIVKFEPDFTIEYAIEFFANELVSLYAHFLNDNILLGASDWQNLIMTAKAFPDFVKDVFELASYVTEKVVEYYTPVIKT